jgi:lambda repressor-like predicted transcriptional regulator
MTTPAVTVARLAKKARDAKAERDKAIRAMHAAGASLRVIAEAAGLNHNTIAKIVKGEEVPDG